MYRYIACPAICLALSFSISPIPALSLSLLLSLLSSLLSLLSSLLPVLSSLFSIALALTLSIYLATYLFIHLCLSTYLFIHLSYIYIYIYTYIYIHISLSFSLFLLLFLCHLLSFALPLAGLQFISLSLHLPPSVNSAPLSLPTGHHSCLELPRSQRTRWCNSEWPPKTGDHISKQLKTIQAAQLLSMRKQHTYTHTPSFVALQALVTLSWVGNPPRGDFWHTPARSHFSPWPLSPFLLCPFCASPFASSVCGPLASCYLGVWGQSVSWVWGTLLLHRTFWGGKRGSFWLGPFHYKDL